jgi:hypothetical protein
VTSRGTYHCLGAKLVISTSEFAAPFGIVTEIAALLFCPSVVEAKALLL